MAHRRQRFRLRTAVSLLVLTLAGAACGGGADDGGSASATTSPPGVTIAAGDPVYGGTLTFGLDAETDGWDPTKNRWAKAGQIVASTVYDPLATYDADSGWAPYLARDFVPNDDYTSWDIELREGVQFHNGNPVDAEAVAAVLDAHLASALSGAALVPVDSVEVVDPLTVRVIMNTPWAVFPAILTAQVGMVPDPTTLENGESARSPVGTGPFVFESWVPDSEWVGTKNENYWREGLPYLDEVVFRPMPDSQTRFSSLQSGDINMAHTAKPSEIVTWRERADAGEVQIIEDPTGEETFVMLNTETPPFDDERARLAIAYATDKEQYVDVISQNILEPANSPFGPTSPWHDPAMETEFPQYDPAQATALVQEYEDDVGPIEFDLTTNSDALDAAQLLTQQWSAVGITANPVGIEQAQLINNAIGGSFTANLWRQFGSPDPDGDYQWWVCANAAPPGEIALNFARNCDPEIDEALAEGRADPDPAVREEAYDRVQERFAVDLPYIWLAHADWAFVADNSIRNLTGATLPDGGPGLPVINGVIRLTEIWRVE